MTTINEIRLRPAMAYAVMKITPLLLLSLIFLLLAWDLSPYFVGFGLAVLCAAWYRLLYIRSRVWSVGPEVLGIVHGVFFKRFDQVEMFRVKDYIITQPLLLRLFGLMTVTLKSTDPETPVIQLAGIPVSDILEVIRSRVQEDRKVNRIYEIN